MSARTWAPDSSAIACPLCHRKFSVVIRRHHCRKCGKVYCGKCTSHKAPLTSKRFQRVCIKCFLDLGHLLPVEVKDENEPGSITKSKVAVEQPGNHVIAIDDDEKKIESDDDEEEVAREGEGERQEGEGEAPTYYPPVSTVPQQSHSVVVVSRPPPFPTENLRKNQESNGSNGTSSEISSEEKALIWFYLDKADNEVGPLTKLDLRIAWGKGEIDGDYWVWNRYMPDWVQINNEPKLKSYLLTLPAPPSAPPSTPPPFPASAKRGALSIEEKNQKKWWHIFTFPPEDPAVEKERLLEENERDAKRRKVEQAAATRNHVIYSSVWFLSTGCLTFIFSVFGGSSWFSVFLTMTGFYSLMTFLIFWYDRCLAFARSRIRISTGILFLHFWWAGFPGGWLAILCCMSQRTVPFTAKCIGLSVFNLFWLAFFLNLSQ